MRQDMHKLNRVRSLDISGQRKLFSRGIVRDWEALPAHQSMRASVPHYTYPRIAHNRPGLRWLGQQVGRNWDDVFSELSERFDRRNMQQAHILENLLKNIEFDVYFDEKGVVYTSGRWNAYRVCGFYVNPETGLLSEVTNEGYAKERAQKRAESAALAAAECIKVSDTLQLRLIAGLWFWVELSDVTAPKTIQIPELVSRFSGEVIVKATTRIDYTSVCRDILSGQEYYSAVQTRWQAEDSRKAYGRAGVYAKRKWQASSRDIERYARPH